MRGILLFIGFSAMFLFNTNTASARRLVYDPNNATHANISKILAIDIKKDFGATGNGTADDQPAFDAASRFINARGGHCKLVIPAGTYRVGRQEANKDGRYMTGQNVLNIGALGSGYKKNIEIVGEGQAILKFKDNLKYGYFTPAGQVLNIAANKNQEIHKEAATLGRCIYIFNAGNVKISNLVLDGNFYPGKMVIGGRHLLEPQGIQQDHYGIYIDYSENITISSVTVRRFGLDGFLIFNASSSRKNITIENCVSDYNGRQGMSILFADKVYVNNTKFTNTGMGELKHSGLQAGIDLEPERADAVIENVYFKNCTFSNSKNASVAITAGVGKVRNIFFDKCDIINVNQEGNSVALDIGRHKGLNFTDCNIYGYVLIAGSGANNQKEGYNFKRCLFSDCYFKEAAANTAARTTLQRQPLVLSSTILIYPPGTNQNWDYVLMDNCIFDVYTKRPWYYLKSAGNKMATISNSVIYANGTVKQVTGGDNIIAQDGNINLVNNKFYLHEDQSYIHNGQPIAPANNKNVTSWNGNTFTRWSAGMPPRVCNSTRKYSSR